MIAAKQVMTMVNTINSVATAAIVGSTSARMELNIRFGSVRNRAVPMNMAMSNSSNEIRNEKIADELQLGMSRLLLKFVQQALLVEQARQPWPSVQGRG